MDTFFELYAWIIHRIFIYKCGYINEILKKCNNKQCLILLKHIKYPSKDVDIDLPETENQHSFLVFKHAALHKGWINSV